MGHTLLPRTAQTQGFFFFFSPCVPEEGWSSLEEPWLECERAKFRFLLEDGLLLGVTFCVLLLVCSPSECCFNWDTAKCNALKTVLL